MTLFDAIAPDYVTVEEVFAFPAIDTLMPQERIQIAGATEKRAREFAAGRVCARRALAKLGYQRFALLRSAERTPVWPKDVVGSISHTDTYCAVAVARQDLAHAIGIDAEPNEPLPVDIITSVCLDAELSWLEGQPTGQRGHLARLFFTAKESFFKCQFSVTRKYLDFQDVRIALDLEGGRFYGSLSHPLERMAHWSGELSGRFVILPDLILTISVLQKAGD